MPPPRSSLFLLILRACHGNYTTVVDNFLQYFNHYFIVLKPIIKIIVFLCWTNLTMNVIMVLSLRLSVLPEKVGPLPLFSYAVILRPVRHKL